MKKFKFQFIVVILILVFFCNDFIVVGFNTDVEDKIVLHNKNDFYFVQLTDTHIRHKIFDLGETTKERLSAVIDHVISFENKPAFIVITGDLTEWGASGISGALNCITFADCFYENNGQLYADVDFSIPVYTTPGNHDYVLSRNLNNYHTYIDKNHVEDEDRYIIEYGDVSLFFMSSGPNYYQDPFDWFDVLGDGLYNCDIDWLENELSSCTSPHKIVLMHHPAINNRNDQGEMHNVIARNREEFVELCETYNVDLVLAGHTHTSKVFDADEEVYNDYPINSNLYSTLYVQSDDCKESIHYRNISIIRNDVWIESSQDVECTVNQQDINSYPFIAKFLDRIR
jgi:predicted MPP superfamily phosphohydrolase